MAFSLDSAATARSPTMTSPAPGAPTHDSATSRIKIAHARLQKHKRRTSGSNTSIASMSRTPPASTSAFPAFDPTYSYASTPPISSLAINTASAFAEPTPLSPPSKLKRRDAERAEDATRRTGGHAHRRSHSGGLANVAQLTKSKIRPRAGSGADTSGPRARAKQQQLDLSLSTAENEDRGVYMAGASSVATSGRRESGGRGYHGRTTSSTSQMSASSAGSGLGYGHGHGSAGYVHPMRQVPQSYRPDIMIAPTEEDRRWTAESEDEGEEFATPLSPTGRHMPFPAGSATSTTSAGAGHAMGNSMPPPPRPNPPASTSLDPCGRLRAETSTPLSGYSSQPPSSHAPTSPPTPTPTQPATARSSIDSAMRRHAHRSRTNTFSSSTQPMDALEQAAAVAALRADFAAREARKEEKYRLREERRGAKGRRRSEELARCVRDGGRAADAEIDAAPPRPLFARLASADWFPAQPTLGSVPGGSAAKAKEKEKAGATAHSSASPGGNGSGSGSGAPVLESRRQQRSRKGSVAMAQAQARPQSASTDALAAIGYASTIELPFPEKLQVADEGAAAGRVPKRERTQGAGAAGKAVRSRWLTFWFRVRTLLLRVRRGLGG